MEKGIKYIGKWFLPNQEDKALSGTLTYIPNKSITLEGIGGLSGENDIFQTFQSNDGFDVIYGCAYNYSNKQIYRDITLFNCSNGAKTYNSNSKFPICIHKIEYCLVGAHIENINNPIFSRFTARIDSMVDWCNPGVLEQYFKFNEEKQVGAGVYFNSDKIKEPITTVEMSDTFQLSLIRNINYNPGGHKINMAEYTEVEFVDQEKMNIFNIRQRLNIFEQFMSFMSLCNVYASEISLFDNTYLTKLAGGTKGNPIKIDLYYVNKNESDAHRYMLVNYNEITSDFPNIIKKWFDIDAIIAPIRNHLIRSLKQRTSYDSTDFVIVAHALEGYYIRFVDNDKDKKIKTRYNNLFNRFRNLQILTNQTFNAKAAADSRNYYSHFFEKERHHIVLDGLELFTLYRQMRVLLICCVLELIGLDLNTIDRITSSSDSKIFKL